MMVALVAAVAGCGSGGTKTVTVTKTSSVHTRTSPAATTAGPATTTAPPATTTQSVTPVKTESLRFFRSPTGNLGCEMFASEGGGARCDIANRSWKAPPKPASCTLDYGQGLQVIGRHRGTFTCAGDTALNPKGTPLPYGEASKVGTFMCASASSGITCTNLATKHGFFISIGSYRLF
jgi:hypothetical protein